MEKKGIARLSFVYAIQIKKKKEREGEKGTQKTNLGDHCSFLGHCSQQERVLQVPQALEAAPQVSAGVPSHGMAQNFFSVHSPE